MGNASCRRCFATANAWWHKAAREGNPPVVHPKVHAFEPETHEEWAKRMWYPP